ncbi:MAG: radical SAM protein, partial [Pseudomonadota bacterium]|nr:radical SAM protein [Pseudomonadota bacterium]
MTRQIRPELFYDTTTSICATCYRLVAAKTLIKEQAVFLEKWCPVHGFEHVLISDDVEYYRMCREVYLKPAELPARFNTPMAQGCPYDCGLCP